MNKQAILDHARLLRELTPGEFYMGSVSCCIAGHIAGDGLCFSKIAELFDIPLAQAFAIAYPEASDWTKDGTPAIYLADGQRAARMLEHLAETGTVDWSVA